MNRLFVQIRTRFQESTLTPKENYFVKCICTIVEFTRDFAFLLFGDREFSAFHFSKCRYPTSYTSFQTALECDLFANFCTTEMWENCSLRFLRKHKFPAATGKINWIQAQRNVIAVIHSPSPRDKTCRRDETSFFVFNHVELIRNVLDKNLRWVTASLILLASRALDKSLLHLAQYFHSNKSFTFYYRTELARRAVFRFQEAINRILINRSNNLPSISRKALSIRRIDWEEEKKIASYCVWLRASAYKSHRLAITERRRPKYKTRENKCIRKGLRT